MAASLDEDPPPETARAPRQSPRVGLVIAGVQKAGTTTLFAVLQDHPRIAKSTPKELHFFDDEHQDWTNPDYDAYERQITPKGKVRYGAEASPSYSFWPQAMERIRDYNPAMRLVLSFRDPVERAFSQWCMNRSRHPDEPDFSEAMRQFAPASLPTVLAETGGRRRSYVARGYYGAQVRRALDLFEREQLLFLDFHRTFGAFRETVDEVTDFLGLKRFGRVKPPQRKRGQPSDLSGAPPTAADIALLVDLFHADLADFSALTGVDVSTWPTAAVAAGRLEPETLAEQLAAKAGLDEETRQVVQSRGDVGGEPC